MCEQQNIPKRPRRGRLACETRLTLIWTPWMRILAVPKEAEEKYLLEGKRVIEDVLCGPESYHVKTEWKSQALAL